MKIKQLVLDGKRKLRRLAGFSLAEVTVGMAVVGTVTGAMLTGISSGFFTMQMARENQRATQIMLEKVETVRLYSWDQINSTGFIPKTFNASYDPLATNGAQGLTYQGTMTITNCPISSSYSTNMKQLTVSVSWKTGNLQRNRDFTTYLTRDGLQSYIY